MKRLIAFIGFMTFCSSGWGAITVSSQTWAADANATSVMTFTINCQGGNLLEVDAINESGFRVTGSTYNGVALTKSTETIDTGGPTYTGIYYLTNPAAGANTVSITFVQAGANKAAGAKCFSGVNTTTPVDVANCSVAGSGGTTITVGLTTTVNNDLLSDSALNNAGNVLTSGSGTLQWASQGGIGAGKAAGSTQGPVGIGTTNMTYTASSFAQPVYCAMAIEPSVAAVTGGASQTMKYERYE
jgi:hypothetical protein